ncbi:SDR family NAD(P)-dependent oxidoreductase, partial [Amaricoccus sp. W119]|uniref:SDR family NAD(P)-dependent oxidoreductase n=1 Tax=Amaricoccus sp. W119 TaxID=3391833 RepID=UPI0039A4994F
MAGRVMLTRQRGKIINVASLLSFFGGLTVPAYATSKGGVMQLTKALSNEWASRGVKSCPNASLIALVKRWCHDWSVDACRAPGFSLRSHRGAACLRSGSGWIEMVCAV